MSNEKHHCFWCCPDMDFFSFLDFNKNWTLGFIILLVISLFGMVAFSVCKGFNFYLTIIIGVLYFCFGFWLISKYEEK